MKIEILRKKIKDEEIDLIQFLHLKKEAIDKIWINKEKNGKFSKEFNSIRFLASQDFTTELLKLANEYFEGRLDHTIRYEISFVKKEIIFYKEEK